MTRRWSLRLDPRRLDDLRPAIRLGPDELGKLVRRAGCELDAVSFHPLAGLRGVEALDQRRVQTRDDFRRNGGWREHAVMNQDLQAGYARFCEGWHVGQYPRALRAGDG